MECPRCLCTHVVRNGHTPKGHQSLRCLGCKRYFTESSWRVSAQEQEQIVKLHSEGLGGRAIGRILGRGETTIRSHLKKQVRPLASRYVPA